MKKVLKLVSLSLSLSLLSCGPVPSDNLSFSSVDEQPHPTDNAYDESSYNSPAPRYTSEPTPESASTPISPDSSDNTDVIHSIRLTGKVLDQNQNPVPFADVRLRSLNSSVTFDTTVQTDNNGEFSLVKVPAYPGLQMEFVLTKSGYETVTQYTPSFQAVDTHMNFKMPQQDAIPTSTSTPQATASPQSETQEYLRSLIQQELQPTEKINRVTPPHEKTANVGCTDTNKFPNELLSIENINGDTSYGNSIGMGNLVVNGNPMYVYERNIEQDVLTEVAFVSNGEGIRLKQGNYYIAFKHDYKAALTYSAQQHQIEDLKKFSTACNQTTLYQLNIKENTQTTITNTPETIYGQVKIVGNTPEQISGGHNPDWIASDSVYLYNGSTPLNSIRYYPKLDNISPKNIFPGEYSFYLDDQFSHEKTIKVKIGELSTIELGGIHYNKNVDSDISNIYLFDSNEKLVLDLNNPPSGLIWQLKEYSNLSSKIKYLPLISGEYFMSSLGSGSHFPRKKISISKDSVINIDNLLGVIHLHYSPLKSSSHQLYDSHYIFNEKDELMLKINEGERSFAKTFKSIYFLPGIYRIVSQRKAGRLEEFKSKKITITEASKVVYDPFQEDVNENPPLPETPTYTFPSSNPGSTGTGGTSGTNPSSPPNLTDFFKRDCQGINAGTTWRHNFQVWHSDPSNQTPIDYMVSLSPDKAEYRNQMRVDIYDSNLISTVASLDFTQAYDRNVRLKPGSYSLVLSAYTGNYNYLMYSLGLRKADEFYRFGSGLSVCRGG